MRYILDVEDFIDRLKYQTEYYQAEIWDGEKYQDQGRISTTLKGYYGEVYKIRVKVSVVYRRRIRYKN